MQTKEKRNSKKRKVIFIPPKAEYEEENGMNINQFPPIQPIYYNYFYQQTPPIRDQIFFWDKPNVKFDNELFESLDVEQIVRNGDVRKLEYYLPKIVNSRILSSSDPVGTDAMVKSFSVMQLGAQYLLKLRKNQFLPFSASPTEQGDSQLMEMNEAMISQTNREIEEMQEIISQLEIQKQWLTKEVRKDKIKRKRYQKKYNMVNDFITNRNIKNEKKAKSRRKKSINDELSEGQVPPEDVKKYQTVHVRIAK